MTRPEFDWVPTPGETIAGKYQVEQLVGVGGMGAVVTAKQLELGRRVAIKLMPPGAAGNQKAVERFLREARAASAIQSDHVVRVYDVGRMPSGMPFMVMEYLPGRTLSALLAARGPLPPAEAIDYVLQVCVALAECHASGIVHRDLKPDNVMILSRPGQVGQAKVLDFGISKSEWIAAEVGFTPSLTGTSDVFGTPTHMSPEQVRSSREVDHRSDIWGLGVVLYELLTARPPFMAETLPALSAMIVSDEPLSPSQHRPDLPPGLAAVILRCLSKAASGRPQSVAELAECLAPYAAPASLAHVERIRGIAALDPNEAARARPAALPTPAGQATAAAWGTTNRRAPGTHRGILLGVAVGVLLFGVMLTVILLGRRPVPGAAASAAAAPSVEPTAATQADPAPVAPAASDAEAPTGASATPISPPSPSPRPKVGGRRAGPLDDRY